MNYFDIAIVIPLIWGGYKGFRKGFIIEVASFIALGLGIWGGVKFSALSAKYLSEVFEISEKVMPLISFSVTFILIVIAVFLIARIIERIIKIVALGFINKAAGAIFGMLKFGLIISVVINLVSTINAEVEFIDSEMKGSSLLYEPISKISTVVIPGIKELNFNTIVDNTIMKEASSKVEEASS
ncbi:MAG: CvpA family protein [Vicingus serpentipes]|nr:CvpA family protein [Vicingus serpentipes]